MTGRERYTARGAARGRFVAQNVLLKSLLHSLVRISVHGTERLKDVEAPFIVLGNHSSHLDTPLIFDALPNRLSKNLATGAAADYWFDRKWKSPPMTLFFNAFPVERGRGTKYRGMAGHLLSDGVPLLIFPEGTRSRTKAMGSFKPGVASLCISRDCPAIPTGIVGASLAMPRGANWPKPGRPPVHVTFGDPMRAEPGENAHEFSDRLAAAVRELHDSTALEYGFPTMKDFEQAAIEPGPPPSTSEPSDAADNGPAAGADSDDNDQEFDGFDEPRK
ncbi:lysophospholipid acyltransferase family protein [Granulicoccus phenolivorans]|uniref:lysophospholipid acyltransferase family protein n=1 Tax=Granulicoccus phenolivorans TaxID=266854 RepID=UPI00054FFF32|nr:lysophospholipid acyltransferase family protein [Granulicoccus phenolivorans]